MSIRIDTVRLDVTDVNLQLPISVFSCLMSALFVVVRTRAQAGESEISYRDELVIHQCLSEKSQLPEFLEDGIRLQNIVDIGRVGKV